MSAIEEPVPHPHLPIRPDWLAQHDEAPLEPELSIIDAHHHIWDHANNRYLHEDVLADVSSGHRIVATVFVECASMYRKQGPTELAPLGETEFVNAIAEASADRPCRIAAGIVGHANLQLGSDVAAVLDAHVAATPGRFRGVRHSSVYHPDPRARGSLANPPPGLLLDAQFRRGFACLGPRGLSFDAWLYHTQIGELEDLAHAFPGTTVVLDHVGGPIGIGPYQGRRDAVFADWRRSIRSLAHCDNVVVKLGGMGMRLFGFDFAQRDRPPNSEQLAAAWQPYIAECIAAFGPRRCMLQSNFPVDKGTASYGVIWNAFKLITRDYGADERNALFHDTAARVYRIPAVSAG
ncbi:amidohydrolase family protein [Piscinibacter sakaiensis]|uniref:amidohydrolase family protein n=1 Tax=Piscinibacter sakaiensis TaxID=1547922 RepID=UPI003AAFBF42